MRAFKKYRSIIILILFLLTTAMIPSLPEEGMYPLSEISDLDLKSAGLKISIDEIYNPNGISLIDALVNTGGCTGSFVSADGLVLTNHHCGFGAVQRASTVENNYLENGFLAKTRDEEIRAEGVFCKITESYEDVSDIILKAAGETEDINKRAKAISKKIREIIKEEESKDSTIEAEVSEMFTGQSYVLFRYKVIHDVRIVYAPPRTIGEFGGETDNWVWPRHTGDFTFLRAYVAPDGRSAPYSKDNVPYHPEKYIEINPDGVSEGDFVFVLGYPARTFKHQPSHFLEYQEKYQLPYLSDLYGWVINYLEEKGKDDPEFALSVSDRIKSLANAEKNYRGKIKGLQRLSLVEKKRTEEEKLQAFISNNPELHGEYGNVLNDIGEVYKEIYAQGRIPLILTSLTRNVNVYRLAEILVEYKKEILKPDIERKSSFTEENLPSLKMTINNLFQSYNPDADLMILTNILYDAQKIEEIKAEEPFPDYTGPFGVIKDRLNNILTDTFVKDKEKYLEAFNNIKELDDDDPLINFTSKINKIKYEEDIRTGIHQSKLNILLAKFMEVKRQWLNKSFIPDANSTLRLTYGHIEGYSPADATYYSPITTIKGILQKAEESGDFRLQEEIKRTYAQNKSDDFKDDLLNDVPVAILYNTDTSGGNSGSPVLDAYGRLVGLNFDRTFEATINDYAWSEDYSRSIGVDIRYILWVAKYISGADNIIRELRVDI